MDERSAKAAAFVFANFGIARAGLLARDSPSEYRSNGNGNTTGLRVRGRDRSEDGLRPENRRPKSDVNYPREIYLEERPRRIIVPPIRR